MPGRIRHYSSLLIAVALVFIVTAPVWAGPPWISIEYPSNPHHPSTRGAAFLVRVYHHSTAITAPVTARAEGLIGDVRKTVDLTVERTSLAGVYAVSGLPEDAGAWVAIITMSDGESEAGAVVTLAPGGRVVAVDVPSNRTSDGWVVPRAITDADVEIGLRQALAMTDAWNRLGDSRPDTPSRNSGAALPMLLIPIGLAFAVGAGGARSRG